MRPWRAGPGPSLLLPLAFWRANPSHMRNCPNEGTRRKPMRLMARMGRIGWIGLTGLMKAPLYHIEVRIELHPRPAQPAHNLICLCLDFA